MNAAPQRSDGDPELCSRPHPLPTPEGVIPDWFRGPHSEPLIRPTLANARSEELTSDEAKSSQPGQATDSAFAEATPLT